MLVQPPPCRKGEDVERVLHACLATPRGLASRGSTAACAIPVAPWPMSATRLVIRLNRRAPAARSHITIAGLRSYTRSRLMPTAPRAPAEGGEVFRMNERQSVRIQYRLGLVK